MAIVMTSTMVTAMVIDDGDSNGDNSANGDDDVSDVDIDWWWSK